MVPDILRLPASHHFACFDRLSFILYSLTKCLETRYVKNGSYRVNEAFSFLCLQELVHYYCRRNTPLDFGVIFEIQPI